MRDGVPLSPRADTAHREAQATLATAGSSGRVPRDPFAGPAPATVRCFDLLGGRFHFRATDPRLLAAVDAAYAGVPPHRLRARPVCFELELLSHGRRHADRQRPAPLGALGRSGILGGATPGSELVMLWPESRRGVVLAAGGMLDSPYHLRYEMIEFAVFTLAARAQSLVPLHAACISHGRRAALLVGDSGTGKSTVSLCALLRGMAFIAEDAVFVEPLSLRATGVANFLHLHPASLDWVAAGTLRRALARSPRIRRRSGVQKLEVDLRRADFRLARQPTQLSAVVFLSRRPARRGALLTPLDRAEVRRRLVRTQPYAHSQASWPAFLARALALPAFELRRGTHPDEGAAALEQLLCASH